MTIQYCESFLLEQLQGVHDFSSDTIKIALFDNSASFDEDTTAYSATNEISDAGYTAGGATLAVSATYPKIETNVGAAVRFDTVSWTLSGNVTIRWALVYNATESNKAILSIDLGGPRTYTSTFEVEFPLSVQPIINSRAPNVG